MSSVDLNSMAKTLDKPHLSSLVNDLGTDFLLAITNDFEELYNESLSSLQKNHPKDQDKVFQSIHKLSGSCSNVGLKGLHDICEQSIADMNKVNTLIEVLEANQKLVIDHLKNYIQNQKKS